MKFYKDKYVKVIFSEYELQMIKSIIDKAKKGDSDFFTEQNLEDLKFEINSIFRKDENK